ncbi:hypothetical protein LZC95_27375 [Pendulispora brunnea]|uniref:Uncharacterized protein n=1 Tax=Pendulispora brunnea TaxID=2905690 RepID=A0ABZ2JZH8_9BACT
MVPLTSHGSWKFTAGLILFGALLIALYWIIWFFVDRSILASQTTDAYYIFENSFPAADAWLAGTSIVGAIGLLRRRAWGLFATTLASSSAIYLGCMDVLYNLQNGVYAMPDKGAVGAEMGINVLSFGIGIYCILFTWQNRASFAR